MTEITTSFALLVSSIYMATSTQAVDSPVIVNNSAISADNSATSTVTIDRKTLEKYLRENFSDTPILVEIARCESTFSHYDKNGQVLRGKVNNADVGVMQINEKYHLDDSVKLGYDIHTVEGNVKYAKYLYKKYGSEPWSASAPCWSNSHISTNDSNIIVKN